MCEAALAHVRPSEMTLGKVLVTGASGFVGRALVAEALSRGVPVRAAVRRPAMTLPAEHVVVGDVDERTDWSNALRGCDAVVHLANLAHAPSSIAELERVNVVGTVHLAQQAADRGVRQLIFLSSIKAIGDESWERALKENDPPRPADAYGSAKRDAERALQSLSSRTGLCITVLRVPLVYGPAVKGNFAALLRAIARGYPLPLGSVENRRSLIYVGNLVDAVLGCIALPDATWRVYHVTDGHAVSTPELVRGLAAGLGRPARMFPFPPMLLELLATLLGRGSAARRLTRSLEVDDTAIRSELGWHPPFTFDEGIGSTTRWYIDRSRARSD